MNLTAIGFIAVWVVLIALAFGGKPVYGLLVYLWVFYNLPTGSWWGDALPDIRWSLIAAVIAMFAIMRNKNIDGDRVWYANWGAAVIVLFAAWLWVQSSWARDPVEHQIACFEFTKYVLLYYIVYRGISDESSLEIFSWGHVVGCFIFGWIAFGGNIDGRLQNVGGTVNNANTLAMHATTGLVFAGLLFLGTKGKRRLIALVAIPFILNLIISTGSRGSMLGMLAAAPVVFYLAPKKLRRSALVAVLLGVVLINILADDKFRERFDSIWKTEENLDMSAQSRFQIIRMGLLMFRDHPLGAGYRGHQALSPDYMGRVGLEKDGVIAAHNSFFAVLVEQGIPGALLYTILQLWVWVSLVRLKRLDRWGLPPSLGMYRAMIGGSWTALFVSGMFSNYMKAEIQVWLVALLAALLTRAYSKYLINGTTRQTCDNG